MKISHGTIPLETVEYTLYVVINSIISLQKQVVISIQNCQLFFIYILIIKEEDL